MIDADEARRGGRNITNPGFQRNLMERYGVRPAKRLGQNLLTDANIIRKIAELSELEPGDTVCEVGPGLGALTAALAARAQRVVAVEKDARIIPALQEALEAALAEPGRTPADPANPAGANADGDRAAELTFAAAAAGLEAAAAKVANVDIVKGDFLSYDLGILPGGYKLTGNLPYSITTPAIMKAVEAANIPASIVFMMQKEVAERICSPPGGRNYGAVSVAVQYRCAAKYAMEVSREVFIPKPGVDSAVVVMTPEPGRCGSPLDEELFFAVVKAGFGQRRKMLRNALSSLVPGTDSLGAAFTKAGVKGTARAETLSVQEFVALSDAISSIRQ